MLPARPYRKMTRDEARKRIPKRKLPAFWVGDLATLDDRLASVRRGSISVLTKSPGNRPIRLVAYGERESQNGIANFNSAVGAGEPAAYLDKAARRKPVVCFVGPVHGHEVEGLTGLANFMHAMETGSDLRGRLQEELRELGGQCRLLILPDGNPDALARFEPCSLQGMEGDDVRFWGQGTWSDDTLCGWPQCKRLHPMRGKEAGFLGCYFDDAGVNPMHDEFFAPMSVSASAILGMARNEGPDLAVSFHSHEGAPMLFSAQYVPLEVRQQVRELAIQYYASIETPKLSNLRVPEIKPDEGKNPPSFNLASAVYHVSGAVSAVFESPHGIRSEKVKAFEFEELLDVQLALYRAMLRFAIQKKRA